MLGTSVGGTCTAPPSCLIRSTAASTSWTPTYPIQCGVAPVHQPGDGGVSDGKQVIGQTGIPRAPAHDIGVEGLGGFFICRHQLVPDETAMRIDHVCFSVRARKEVAAPAFEAS